MSGSLGKLGLPGEFSITKKNIYKFRKTINKRNLI